MSKFAGKGWEFVKNYCILYFLMRKQIIIKEIEQGNSQTITQFLDGAEWHFLLYGSRKNINFVGNEGQRKGRYFCEQRKFGSGVRDGVAYIYT